MIAQIHSIQETFENYREWGKNYFLPWTYKKPLLISPATNERVGQLQKILHKVIQHYVQNYEAYEYLMPLDKEVKRVLNYFKDTPYKVGSYRTDFVIDKNKQFRIIEITCRFTFNGFWVSGFLDNMAQEYGNQNGIDYRNEFDKFLNYLDTRLQGRKLVILSHKGKGEESRHYQQILVDAGYDVKKVFIEDAPTELMDIEDKVFITEFNQDEYYALSDQSLRQLAKAEVLNDLRTVFLIHDKRFFSILGNEAIRKKVLSREEVILLDQFYIPTYAYGEAMDNWQKAKETKNNWIVKHKHLGKSAQVFAGLVTEEVTWQSLFESREIENMILQPFIKQPQFKGTIGKQAYEDYVVGTMLFYDHSYFGLGFFRASSHPVTNVIDDRKLTHLHLTKDLASTDYYTL